MTLHIDRSTVGRETPLAPLTTETDPANRRPADARTDDATRGQDQAAISQQGQRLAGLNEGEQAQLNAVNAADELVRKLIGRMQANPEAAKAAHSNLDPSRVASLLE